MAEIASSVIRRPVTVLAVGALALAGRAFGQTSLSIYSDGRVVVRRTLPQALEKGRTALTLKIDGLDPATLFSPDTSVPRSLAGGATAAARATDVDRKSTRLNSSHDQISYAVFCLKKKIGLCALLYLNSTL